MPPIIRPATVRLPLWAAHVLTAVLVSALPLTAQSTLSGELQHDQRHNILLLIADDLGVEGVGAYGKAPDPPYTPHTPNLDHLASEGVLFRNCWANPGCSPTRATMLTGRYSFRTGIGQAINYLSSSIELAPQEIGIPQRLGGGYRSGALGKWHLATKLALGTGPRHPERFGFDVFRGSMKILPGYIGNAYYSWEKYVNGQPSPSTTYATTDTVNDALAFIDQSTDAGKPWFLWVAFHAPHAPFHKPPANLHTYTLPPNVGDDVTLHMYAMTEALDTEIGRLIESMDPDVRDNTVFIFIGDNGSPASVTAPPLNPSHSKNTVYQGGLHVPLIVAGPGVARGASCEALVNSTDIFATVVDIAHAQTPGFSPVAPKDSVSLTPYLDEPAHKPLRPWVYAEYFTPNGITPTTARRTMRLTRFKLIQSVDSVAGIIGEELYDLAHDPGETTNLLDFPPLPAKTKIALKMLRDELELLDPSAPWHDFDGDLAGMKNAPALQGSGVPTPGSIVGLQLTNAPPGALGLLVTGSGPTDRLYEGGVILPGQRHGFPVLTDELGQLDLTATWPEGSPHDGALVFQIVFPESGGDGHMRAVSNRLILSLR